MKTFTVVIETLKNASRDSGLDNPEVKSVWYEIDAENEQDAKNKGKNKFDIEYPYAGIWDIDAY